MAIDPVTKRNLILSNLSLEERVEYNKHVKEKAPVIIDHDGYRYFCRAATDFRTFRGQKIVTLKFFDLFRNRWLPFDYYQIRRDKSYIITFREDFGEQFESS